jgi:hypothetical protein
MIDDTRGPMDDPDGEEGEVEDRDEREHWRLFERAVPEVIRRLLERAIVGGVEKISEQPENIRHFLGEMKLPKDVLNYIYGQIDDTKKGLYRVVAREIRDVLEHTDFAEQIARMLTKLSFEISTQIRFVPNPEAVRQPGQAGPATGSEGDDEEGGEPTAGEKTPDDETARRAAFRFPRPRVTSKVRVRRPHRPRGGPPA